MSKESFIGGDYIETTGGLTKIYAGENIENSSGKYFAQNGAKAGVSHNINSPAPSLGNVNLEKIVINTSYDVCNDEVLHFNDYKNFWILEDKGKYYHWLNIRANSDDKNKPDPLPVTLSSIDNFVLKATFKTKAPISCIIRIKDSNNKFIFKEEKHPKKAIDEEFEIKFTCNIKPYKDTVQYLENFTLIFEYSEDGKNWAPMKSVKFCLYLTWRAPLWSMFENLGDSTSQMQIKNNAFGKKQNILETLLWLGCNQAQGKGKNEEEIVDTIFKDFETLKVTRKREGEKCPDGTTQYLTKDWSNEGLGYWRGQSTSSGGGIDSARAVALGNATRYLIAHGEARCGEWTAFFVHILQTQGINVNQDTKAICTEWSSPNYPNYSDKEGSYGTLGLSLEFAVKSAVHNDVNRMRSIMGHSPGQGNPTSQPTFSDHVWFYYKKKRYFDVSYGKSFSQKDSNLKEYCSKSLGSIYLAPKSMTTIPPLYPGGIGTIITVDIQNHIKSTI